MPPDLPSAVETLVVALHDDALSDPLLQRSFGRMLAGSARRPVLVHGDGGSAARAFEAAAVFDAPADEQRAARAQATYVLNRVLTARWSDDGAVITGLNGSGRAVFQQDDGGAVSVRAAPVEALLGQGVVPLVAALAERPDGSLAAVPVAEAAAALARALGATGATIPRSTLPGGGAATGVLAGGAAAADAQDERAFQQSGCPYVPVSVADLLAAGLGRSGRG